VLAPPVSWDFSFLARHKVLDNGVQMSLGKGDIANPLGRLGGLAKGLLFNLCLKTAGRGDARRRETSCKTPPTFVGLNFATE
jgi:hypothetical protein